MDTLFALLSLIALIAAVIGLIRPSVVMPAKWKPARLKALAIYLLAFIAFVSLGTYFEPPEARQQRMEQQAARQAQRLAEIEAQKAERQRIAAEQEAEAARAKAAAEQAAAEKAAIEATALAAEQGKGIGVARSMAFMVFNERYTIRPSSNVGRLERWMGKADMGTIELLGAENNLTAMTLVIGVDPNDLAGSLGRLGDLSAALRLAFPTWTGSKDWLAGAIARLPSEPDQEIVRNGLRVSLSGKSVGLIILSIDGRDKQPTE